MMDMTQDTPGTTEARETLESALRRYRLATKKPYPSRASAERAAERRIYLLVKREQPRGALVFVQLGATLMTFDNDARRLSRELNLPSPCSRLRLRRESCDSLLDSLRERAIDVQIVRLDNR